MSRTEQLGFDFAPEQHSAGGIMYAAEGTTVAHNDQFVVKTMLLFDKDLDKEVMQYAIINRETGVMEAYTPHSVQALVIMKQWTQALAQLASEAEEEAAQAENQKALRELAEELANDTANEVLAEVQVDEPNENEDE